ncbi:N-glycosidase YbiA [Trametes pubescens]|uniref:N-glycosidase YbiA n=1 Tax=Trametes pubescens TaxID=154538 RepID=A0A1M2VSD4_TRAPU|nr:N-glycosidase YbiA [Trametes pubescens]
MPGQPLVFPQPQMHSVNNPVIPPMPTMSGAMPTAGNPFPAPPMNMGMGMGMGGQEPNPHMGMPQPVIPGQGQNPEAPVIPPIPSNFGRAGGTPYHPAGSYPDSSDSESYDDELSPQTRERLQPPLAPGQYGPFDRNRERRGTPAPALRRGQHRRAESSPVFGQQLPPGFVPHEQPPVIPPPGVAFGPGQQPFPQFQNQGPPIYHEGERFRREPSPDFRPRPWTPLRHTHNPLPPPPKDIFQHSPYAQILRELRKPVDAEEIKAKLSQAPAFTTIGAIPIATVQPGHYQGTRSSKEKKRKGLFRSISARLGGSRRDDESFSDVMSPPQGGMPQQAFVGGQSITILPTVEHLPDGTTTLTYHHPSAPMVAGQNAGGIPMAGGGGQPPVMPSGVMPGYVPGVAPAVSPAFGNSAAQQQQQQQQQQHQHQHQQYPQSPGPQRMPTPQPAPPPPPRPIRIDRTNRYHGLLHMSPHKVHYGNKSYPTVLHLIEALRFLPGHPENAEEVRRCGTAEEAAAISGSMRSRWRGDLEQVFSELVEEALYQKFIQHERLRDLLLETGEAELIYSDPNDTFWGDGPMGQGMNALGQALCRVRDRLRRELET